MASTSTPLDCPALWRTIGQAGKRQFLITPQQQYSYADLRAAVLRWLELFDTAELADGDRVAICSGHEFAVTSCFIAALLDGKVAVNLAADTPAARLSAILRHVDARCLISDHASLPPGASAAIHHFAIQQGEQQPKQGLLARLSGKSAAAMAGLPPKPSARDPLLPTNPRGLAYVLFTSGTTSAPTGVQITRGNLFANLTTLTRLFAYDAGSRIFNDMILAHADGMIQGPVLALANGGAVIRAGGFSLPGIEGWLEQVRAAHATHFITVPTIWTMIDAYAAHSDYFDAPECTSLQSVAAKLPEDLWQRLEARFGHPIANHYGLTETVASALYAGPHVEMGPMGTIGRPVDCEARIDPLTGDTQGELQLRGDNVFSGYWDDIDRTAASFTADGWLKTGDIARQNDDGSFTIMGRLKTIIMSGGFLIRPEEIDEVMLGHPAVRESVSVAVPDANFGEIAATVIVLDGVASVADLLAHARSGLEAQKVPRRIVIVASIPRGISGKPKLAEIQQMLQPDHAAPPAAANNDLALAVIALAADVFRVPADKLSLSSGPDQIAGWDSFSHLSLVLEAERQFGIAISAARIAALATLADLHQTVAELQS